MKPKKINPDTPQENPSHFPDVFDAYAFMATNPVLPVSKADEPDTTHPFVHPEMRDTYKVAPTHLTYQDDLSNSGVLEDEMLRQHLIHQQELEKIRFLHEMEIQRMQLQAQAESAYSAMASGEYLMTDTGHSFMNQGRNYHPSGFSPIGSPLGSFYGKTAREIKEEIELQDAMNQAAFTASSAVMRGDKSVTGKLFNSGRPGDSYWANVFGEKQNSSGDAGSEGVNPTGL